MFEIIKSLCREEGISITSLCREVTGSSGNLETWKKGYMRSDCLVKIARYFEVSVDFVLGISKSRKVCKINEKVDIQTLSGEEQGLVEMYRKLSIRGKIKVLSTAVKETDEIKNLETIENK
ncbi:MAG: helix-turn-helix transcriptional regulator [Clostridiales bacterium]|jgi:hypothetical protein|nr:helix-turn-helix transcriptional regulator [Clostridiales bacterium]